MQQPLVNVVQAMEVWAHAADESVGKDICLWSVCDLLSSLVRLTQARTLMRIFQMSIFSKGLVKEYGA